MNRLLYILILIITSFNITQACSCIYQGEFCTVLPIALEWGAVVVSGSPVESFGHGMTFEIDEVYEGEIEESTITIWGDSGYLCRLYVTGFQSTDKLLMILHPIIAQRKEYNGYVENVGDYEISGCGQYFMYLNGEYAETPSCININDSESVEEDDILAYPNPVLDDFYIKNVGAAFTNLRVFAYNGQLVFDTDKLEFTKEEEAIKIATHHWQSGVYLLELKSSEKNVILKVVKL